MRSVLLSSLLIVLVKGQWGNLFGLQQQPQWSPQPLGQPIQPNNIFGNLFNPFTLLPSITTTTTPTTAIRMEDVPNPDLEQGNWPLPNPANWPVGPDWNDERNTWEGEFGWGGKDSNSIAPVSIIRASDNQK